ncbi:peptidylprolyl isomerase [Sphingomicrobium arenosum]|uniref:peptidylprolyl isomerase n=1 Tax=Sphingomicrobium arenosum TaxID=2233861 RepID=UPI00224103EC|nr:peptidylprolyl isomerase [Sphingomicrobium arenosum]
MIQPVAALLAALVATHAQEAAPPPAEPMAIAAPEAVESPAQLVRVRVETAMGPFVLELDEGAAPLTAGLFLDYVANGALEHATFYRAMPYGDAGIAQFGIRRGDKLLPAIAHESTADTGILHERGVISLIAPQPGQGQGDWFIALTDIPGFDASADFHGFTPFGRVVEGMEIIEAIFAAPTDPQAGEGVMKGQMLAAPVAVTGASRED